MPQRAVVREVLAGGLAGRLTAADGRDSIVDHQVVV
jgi:hypothetical protein